MKITPEERWIPLSYVKIGSEYQWHKILRNGDYFILKDINNEDNLFQFNIESEGCHVIKFFNKPPQHSIFFRTNNFYTHYRKL